MEKYTYVTTCRDAEGSRYSREYLSDDILKIFETKEEAFRHAVESAEEEVASLNGGHASGRGFGIPEDEDYKQGDVVKVFCYLADDTAELVTRRSVREAIAN